MSDKESVTKLALDLCEKLGIGYHVKRDDGRVKVVRFEGPEGQKVEEVVPSEEKAEPVIPSIDDLLSDYIPEQLAEQGEGNLEKAIEGYVY